MRILISNDDGVYSPGLSALGEVAREFGEIKVFAPDVDRAASGHALSPGRPITWKHSPIGIEACRVDGTPADCVAVGCALWSDVDVVIAGINLGPNLAEKMWNSGTLAAAKEACLLGSRGIAISREVPGDEPDYEALKPILRRVLSLTLPLRDIPLINVNLPAGTPKGILWTHQSVRYFRSEITRYKDPSGNPLSWFSISPIGDDAPLSDVCETKRGYVSLTPIRLDLTDHEALRRCRLLSQEDKSVRQLSLGARLRQFVQAIRNREGNRSLVPAENGTLDGK